MATTAERIEAIRNRGNTSSGAGLSPSASQNTNTGGTSYTERIDAIRNRGNEGTTASLPDYSKQAESNFTPAVEKEPETLWDKLLGLVGVERSKTRKPVSLGTSSDTGDKEMDAYLNNISGKATAAVEDKREGVDEVNYGKLMTGVARKGINQAMGGLTSTADWLIGNPLKAVGWENNPVSWLNQEMKNEAKLLSEIYDENASKSKPAQLFDKYGSSAVAALPQAAIAFYSGGLSLGTQGTTAALQTASTASKASSLGNTISSALGGMLKNPQYWTSFSQTAGNSYEQAKHDGAGNLAASAYAMTNGLVNSLIEVGGGGIQDLPADLRSGSAPAIYSWVMTAIDEGNEEMIQGVIERGLQNLVYHKNNPLVSNSDPNAIINPKTMVEDYAGGFAVGGLLGGGQIATNALLSNKGQATQSAEEQNAEPPATPAETTTESISAERSSEAEPSIEPGRVIHTEENIIEALAAKGMSEQQAAAIAPTLLRVVTGDTTLSNSELMRVPLRDSRVKAIVSEYTGAQIDPQETSASRLKAQYKAATEAAAQAEGVLPFGMGAAAGSELRTPFTEWRDNSTAPEHEIGEKATRYLGVPTIDLEGKRTMKTGQTIAEAATTTDENAAVIENLYVNGDLSYVPNVDSDLAAQAAEDIAHNGWSESVKNWTADVRGGKVSPELVARGAQLINNAGQANNANAKEYADLVIDYSNLLHNAGQSLQAARILKMLTPEGRLYGIQKSVEKLNEEVGTRYEVSIPQNLLEEYHNAATEAERDVIVGKMQKAIAKRLPSKLTDKWTALRYVNMLGNFRTQERNILSNVGNLINYRLKDEVATLVETIVNFVKPGTVERTKSAFVGRDWMRVARKDFTNVQDAALGEGKYNDGGAADAFGRGVDRYRSVFKNSGTWGTKKTSPGAVKLTRKITDALWKVPEAYRRVTNWSMEKGDLIFSKAAYSRSLAGFLKARGVTPEQFASGAVDPALLEDARVYAIKQAQEVTLRDRNAFSDAVSKMFRGDNTPKAIKIVGEGASPFRRTPANAMVRMEEFSPLGFITTAYNAAKAKKHGESMKASDIIDEVAKSLTGTGLMILGYALRENGLIRASGDREDEDIDALNGAQDWSIVIPGIGSYTFDWASASVLPVFMGAQLNELFADEQLEAAEVFSALSAIPEPVLEMSMLSGLNDTLENAQYSESPLMYFLLASALNYYTQGMTNSLFGQLERISEPNRMTTYIDPDNPLPESIQLLIGKNSAKVPGWDYQQTEYHDEFGQRESSGTVVQRIIDNLLSPGYWEPEKNNKAVDFATWVHENTDVKAFPDTSPPKTLTYDEETYTLTQQEREMFQRIQGEAAQEYLEAAGDNKEFKSLDKEQQEDIVSGILSRVSEDAKYAILNEKGIDAEPSAATMAAAELPPDVFVNWLVETATTETPPTYESTPKWQTFEIAAALPDPFALSLIIAQGGTAGERVRDAVEAGVPLDTAVAYYRATTERNADGKEPSAAEKRQRINDIGLTMEQRGILNRIFG